MSTVAIMLRLYTTGITVSTLRSNVDGLHDGSLIVVLEEAAVHTLTLDIRLRLAACKLNQILLIQH